MGRYPSPTLREQLVLTSYRHHCRRAAAVLALTTSAVLIAPPTAGAGPSRAEGQPAPFDLQAHRGGIAMTVESTLPAFAKALRVGVSTLELDVQITADRRAVVTHDRQVSEATCRDTAPVTPGDPDFPYVGRFVKDLTLAQVRTLDCGSRTRPEWPGAQTVPGARMALLSEVFALVHRFDADDVMLNVETKVEAGAPEETAPRGQFVRVVAAAVRAAELTDQVTVQSFDWGALMQMQEVAPELPVVALDNEQFLEVGQPGSSPWLGGIDIDDFDGDPVAAVASFGAEAYSPVQGSPQNGSIDDPDFTPYVTRRVVERAHRSGLGVIPWTVDDRNTMAHFMDLGVDGLITNRPEVLRDLMAERGLSLPPTYHDPRAGRVTPLAPAHAHNDYEHERPLSDALAQGFTSVEADVWLIGGELRVAHDRADSVPGRTLDSLYLEPLARRVDRREGSVYAGWDGSLQLLIDIKSGARRTYTAIHQALRAHRDMLTRFAPVMRDGAVEVVISGNRPKRLMLDQNRRWAGYDGRLADLGSGLPASFMPLVSDNWTNAIGWDGTGPLPAADHERLLSYVRQAHAAGYRIRFWETPDAAGEPRTTIWSVLYDIGVDHLNTDDLAGLARFAHFRQPTTS